MTKNGNYFYLVIDRAGKTDNVYLLNMVDEADLIALIEKEPKPEPPPPMTEPVPQEKSKNSTLPLLMIVLSMCGGGAFYYLKFVKNKDVNKGDSDLSEFEDDNDDYDLDDAFGEDSDSEDYENNCDEEI